MKKLLIFLLSALSLTAVAQQKKVAVYVTGEDAGVNKVLGSKLVAAIARSNEYSAIERTDAFLSQLAKEQSYQRTGAVDDSEISRLGKQFGVQYVCVATVSKAFNEDYISARLIDVETAQVERTASSAGAIQSLDDLINAANTLSNDLLARLKERQQDVKKVAVYVVKSDAASNIGRVLGDKLVAGFTNSGKYIAIERTNSFLSQLSKEQNYQRTGAVDDNDISRLGKQFGVQYVCIADVSEVFGEKYISARLVDVETAEVVNSYDTGGKLNNMNSCLTTANTIATNLSKGTFKEQMEEERIRQERLRSEELAKINAKQEAINKKKAEWQDVVKRGYIIVEDYREQQWMICLEPLSGVTARQVLEHNTYYRKGYSDWEIGKYLDFRYKMIDVISEIKHYLGINIPIFESGHNYVYSFYGRSPATGDVTRTGLTRLKPYESYKGHYLDGDDIRYIIDIGESEHMKGNDKADAILVRKVK